MAGDDVIYAGAGADVIYAGAGNDTIYTQGGADVVYAGEGDDAIHLDNDSLNSLSESPSAMVDAGLGFDTVFMDEADQLFDLSAAITAAKLKQVEKVDITGTGANTLKLDMTALLEQDLGIFDIDHDESPDLYQQLMVDGDAGDSVILEDLSSWNVSGNYVEGDETYAIYEHATEALQLLINTDITDVNNGGV